ncbi:glycosyltransferase [Zunongwangia sp. F363]|uniref:Glycosyltransferase n=1 Tax=Autumnicola tepida TaxID=3075595 RepID=A0ABU3C9M6_9FLAO|nr:glycosyltransferase [Zunongwangia sp. F363]MDT0643041.1 glycosyltransferase [Zunongwangia sp. F363]
MDASILIVSKNRREELAKTLGIIEQQTDAERHEIRVFLDGSTDDSESLKKEFPKVHWMASEESLGASKARNLLYKTAKGKLFFGFDDDAHPLQADFINVAKGIFEENPRAAIIGFKEIKGIWDSDEDIGEELLKSQPDYLANDFVGCGFVIKKEVYNLTRGFPTWIDIYGEEWCLAIEVLEKDYEILYTHKIFVQHRVDKTRRGKSANYFRFGKQLKNTSYFYLVYYPFPLLLKKIGRLYFLNFKKYALKDINYFKEFWKAFLINIFNAIKIFKVRRPVSRETLLKFNKLSNPHY